MRSRPPGRETRPVTVEAADNEDRAGDRHHTRTEERAGNGEPGDNGNHDIVGVWSPGVRRLTAGLSMTITLVAFESLSVATILPVVSRHLGDLRLYGWVFSAFFLSSLVGIVVSGAVSDSRGIGLPLVGGLLIFGAGLAIAGTA
jgi:hypothetical protein